MTCQQGRESVGQPRYGESGAAKVGRKGRQGGRKAERPPPYVPERSACDRRSAPIFGVPGTRDHPKQRSMKAEHRSVVTMSRFYNLMFVRPFGPSSCGHDHNIVTRTFGIPPSLQHMYLCT